MLRRLLPILFAATLLHSPAVAQPPVATTLTLASDAATVPVRTVVHLTAALQSPSPATGSITFLDNGQPLLTLPLNSHNLAVLAIASLPQGTHTLTASYSGDSANSPSTSAPVALSVTPLPSSFTATASASTTYAGTPITLTASGLPTPATGTIAFTDAAITLATPTIPGTATPRYQALGDSITYGYTLPTPATRYVNQFAAAYGFIFSNFGFPGSVACDILPTQILPNNLGPTEALSPLSSLMIGTNDAIFHYNQPYLPNFQTCHQADLAWLAIPREYKVLPGDSAATVLSGTWTSHPGTYDQTTYGTLFNSSGAGTARFSVTSSGAPLYLWYLLGDNLPGTFTLALDGTSTGTAYSTRPATPITSIIASNTASIGYALLRLPASAGPHTLDITVQSGTVGILAAATPPSPGIASVHPTVLVSDLPNQLASNPYAPPAAFTQYTQAIQQDLALLAADGLDLRLVPTQQFMLGTDAEMSDQVHPNVLGHQHLAAAFQSVFATSPLAPYSTFSNAPTSAAVTLNAPGPHSLTATYSGDNVYAATAAPPLAITVTPQTISATTLSTYATRYPARTPVTFTAAVLPASASGTVTFYDGTTQLAQLPLASGSAAFTTSTLAPGLHSLTAAYSGDSPDTPSASPTLAIEIDLDAPTLTLAPIPATSPYGTSTPLTVTINPTAATGSITFLDTFTPATNTNQIGAQQLTLGQATLANGTATLTPTGLLPGTHTITASYPGDALDLASTSPAATIQITAVATSTTLVATATTLAYGSTEILTATVSPATAMGTVTLHDSISGTLPPITLANGTATFTSTTLTPGPHTLIASYSGDTGRAPSTSPSISVQVNPAPTSVALSPLPATISAGTTVTLTATLIPATATGAVVFRDATSGTLGQATVANGTATFPSTTLPPGSYSITAIYSGDPFNAPSSSLAVNTKIVLAATTTTLAPLPTSILYATPTTLTATVAPATATGQITFTDTVGTSLGTAILANGTATLPLANLASGPHTLHAVYSGDPLDAPSTSAPIQTTITVNPTATTLSLALTNVPVGTPVIFNIRVNSPLTSSPSGTVTVRSGTTILGSGPLASSAPGVAYATLSASSTALGPGTFPIVATYSGDPADASSDSSAAPALSFTILPIPTTLAFTLSATQIPAQAPITLAATITSGAATPTGTISFFQNNTLIAAVPATGTGTASTILKGLAIGGYKITATFTPTGLFAAASASAQDLTVSPPISIALTPSAITGGPSSTATSTLVVTPLFGFNSTVQATCQPSVSWVTCSIDSVPAITTAAPVSSTVHISIAANTLASNRLPAPATPTVLLALLLPILAFGRTRRTRLPMLAALLLAATALASLTGCAEGGTFGNVPAGTHTVQINVLAGGATFTTTLTVNVTQ